MGNGPRAKKQKKKEKNNFSDLIKEEEEGPAVIDTQFFCLLFFSGFFARPRKSVWRNVVTHADHAHRFTMRNKKGGEGFDLNGRHSGCRRERVPLHT